jgi:hypothetical protein
MKAFQKWVRDEHEAGRQVYAVRAWKAALKWVLSIGYLDFDQYDEPTGDLIIDTLDIKDELDEKK